MQTTPHERLSVLAWLEKQHRILIHWRDELLADPDGNDGLISALEEHQRWLGAQIANLTKARTLS